ncbi:MULTISPECIES: ACT domain-containing protein [unclassified Alteromonas]|uniref:ACT domain-containing protein n=1 Tax=unclassified Alteromonas TaxID=2614992 RepID=UPI000E68937A|nr:MULTISPECIES: ACT domain-containing protein [unclassified Alteromonas]AYA64840.1 ACT domain-containing protein [Alteromonas sp. RKMC-009]MDO6476130.1 ACT domain-containing protein [Alteromonas sp. 1_MG-2023]
MKKQTLAVIDGEFTIHAFDPNSAIPAPVLNSDLFFIGKTEDTLSVVVPSSVNLVSLESDKGWRALELLGPLELSMVGIMANLGTVLAKAKVSMFIVSTFDTDFFLVKADKLHDAVTALQEDGYTIVGQ